MELTEVQSQILVDLLVNGHNPSGNIADNISRSRTYTSESIQSLIEMGLIEDKGRKTYKLTDAGVAIAQNRDVD